MEVNECKDCKKTFTFDTSKCGQIILKQGQIDAAIIFLPKCPHCQSINTVELPWKKYGVMDY